MTFLFCKEYDIFILHWHSFFNKESAKMEKKMEDTNETIQSSIAGTKKLKWILWTIIIPLWGAFITTLVKAVYSP